MSEMSTVAIGPEGQDRFLAAVVGVAHLLHGFSVEETPEDIKVSHEESFLGSYTEGDESISVSMSEKIDTETGIRSREMEVSVSQHAPSEAGGKKLLTIHDQVYTLTIDEDEGLEVKTSSDFNSYHHNYENDDEIPSERDEITRRLLRLGMSNIFNDAESVDGEEIASMQRRLDEINDHEAMLRELVGDNNVLNEARLNTVVAKLESLAKRYAA